MLTQPVHMKAPELMLVNLLQRRLMHFFENIFLYLYVIFESVLCCKNDNLNRQNYLEEVNKPVVQISDH